MAAYAALLSVMQTVNHIKNHPHPPISIDKQQLHSLAQNLAFLQNFLELYSSREDEDLENRIVNAAYAAEDVIESQIVGRIQAASSISSVGSKLLRVEMFWQMSIIFAGFPRDLERVIGDMDLIKKEVMEIMIKEKNTGAQLYDDQLHRHSSVSTVSASSRQSIVTAVFDEVLINEVLDQLSGQQSNLQIISIDGMGGIGKTTLARNIYLHPLIVEHFDILVWVTISQVYSRRKILLQVLSEENKGSEMREEELGERVHKKLWGRRYFIVMDDMWSTEALDKVRCYFPDNNNGSRIMITTRLSKLAFELSGSHVFRVKFLDEGKSWDLLCETVFGNKLGCPMELEHIGKEIARNCRGLPLSIVVIGGLLTKSNGTRAHWEHTLQNLNSLIYLEDGEYCLQILRNSYKELPIHLKPCFLYMGIFQEDHEIRVKKLIELWVAEGILRPTTAKILEEVAEECINELIDRNLILVDELSWNGKAKVCKIHDLLRDLCLREARKQRFLCVLKHVQDLNIPECMNMERRICIHDNAEEKYSPALESASLTRSLISTSGWPKLVNSRHFRLQRVYSGDYHVHCNFASAEAIFKKPNMRFVSTVLRMRRIDVFPASWFLLWNLQTLKIVIPSSWGAITAPSEIWEMPLLRHVIVNGFELPDPICGENDLILEHLQTLSFIRNLKCSEAVIKRIRNVKTLKLRFEVSFGEAEYHRFGVNNICQLTKLQSLSLSIGTAIFARKKLQRYPVQNLSFPHSLKKLTLDDTMFDWEECTTKIGSLPLLEYLRLCRNACCGAEWETVEGQFCSLKVLEIACYELRYWTTEESSHFPRLERLVLRYLQGLEEIPSSIGDITTLKSIRLDGCSTSAEDSAKRIQEEQLELENTDLHIRIVASGAQNSNSVDAVIYLHKVKDTLGYQQYEEFLDVLGDYRAQRIDTDGYVSAVKVLFKGHPSLIPGLKISLPEGYEITLSDDEEDSDKDEEDSDDEGKKYSKLPIIGGAMKVFSTGYHNLILGLNKLLPEGYKITLTDDEEDSDDEAKKDLIGGKVLFKGHPNFIPGINMAVPEGYEITIIEEDSNDGKEPAIRIIGGDFAQKPTLDAAESYLKEVVHTFQFQKEKCDRFYNLITDLRDERIDIDDAVSVVKVLFKGYPNLILGFSILLPEGYDQITFTDHDEDEAPSSSTKWDSSSD